MTDGTTALKCGGGPELGNLHRGAEMPRVRVFDPALCCSSGVCGSEPDAALLRFAADPLIRERLGTRGGGCLPIVLVDGEVLTEGRYPTRAELEAKLADRRVAADATEPGNPAS